MEQQEQSKSDILKEDRKVQAENMRLKKKIKALEAEIDRLTKYLGGIL